MFKDLMKKNLALLLAVVMVFGVLPSLGFLNGGNLGRIITTAKAASVTSGNGTWISGKLTYSYTVATSSDNTEGAAGSVSVSNSTLTVKATSAKEYETGGCNSTTVQAAATTTTVTVTNASSYPLLINSLSVTGDAVVAGLAQGQTIAPGATFTISVTSPAAGTSSVEKSGTVTINASELTSVTITAVASPYVSYTIYGNNVEQNGSSVQFTVDVGTVIKFPAITAPSGYEFKGWRVGADLVTAVSFTADSGYSVYPVIVSSSTPTTGDNFKVGASYYTFWNDAVRAAILDNGVIVVAQDVMLPSTVEDNLLPAAGSTYVKPVSGGGVEYIIPAGITLVVPKDTSTTVHTTTPEYKYEAHATPYAFRTLTLPSGTKITVNGSVSVDSKVSANGQGTSSWNGTPSGPHGKIVMKSGSEMTFNSGANLYCYGYINGDGNIYMKSGSKVYELFQLRCWRGGTATSDMAGNTEGVFPLNQYYVQNVEAPMTIYKGATEYVWSVVNMKSTAYPTNQIEFIGDNGMFKLTGSNSDYITKRYHPNVDRLEVAAHGNMSLNALNIKVSGLPLIGSIEVNSRDYVLPINNMDIVVETGTTSIASSQTKGVAFLPSSKLTVNEGAIFTVNAPTYFYDSSDWGLYGSNGVAIVPVGYSTANGDTTLRTADNLKDAELDVNGTVTVSNKLYTTESGAHFTSSEGTGEINFTSAPATGTTTTYQAIYADSSISYVGITCNNAWLQNGDESYSYTVSTGVSNWYYDKPGEHWYRYLVDFVYDGNAIARDYYCENNDTVTYDASWLANLGASVTSGSATAAVSGTNVNVTNVTANSVVTLTGAAAEFIPTFILNEKQYSIYQFYTGNTLSNTAIINGETYYIVAQAPSALAVGTEYAAPTDASMGVTAANHNTITWNMSGLSATSGDPYRGTVPVGETAGGPAYVYGFYTGVVAHNSWNDQYYTTLIGAFEVLPQDVTATITLLADCGTFEDESSTVAYTAYSSNNITLDLNGHKAVGRIINQGTFTLELNGGTLDYHTGATAAAAAYAGMAAVINSGTMTIQDSVGGGSVTSDAISNSSTNTSYSSAVRNNPGATLTITGGTIRTTETVNGYSANILNLSGATIDLISGGTFNPAKGCGLYNL